MLSIPVLCVNINMSIMRLVCFLSNNFIIFQTGVLSSLEVIVYFNKGVRMANNIINQQQKLDTTQLMLKLTYGIVPIVAGADKFTNILTDWQMYYNPAIFKFLPITPALFSYGIGIIEICAGLLVLSAFTRYGAYVVAAWLTLIALSLFSMGHFYDVAVRDLVMAVGAVALARLTEIKEAA